MDKIEIVAQMAAAIYAADPARRESLDDEEMYQRAAAQAWGIYDAVEKIAAERFAHW